MSSISKLIYFILTLAIGYAFVYPSFGELKVLMDEKQKQENSLEMISQIEIKKNEVLDRYNKISVDDKKAIETFLPSNMDFVKLVSQINTLGAKYGFSIKETSIKELGSSANSIAEASSQDPYHSAIIGFSFETSYEHFNNFMNDLGKSLRILDVRSVKLAPQKGGIYSYDAEFKVYWLKK